MGSQDLRLIELDFIDSTNNYAMRLIDDDKAQPGLTIVSKQQGNGKGQRGRVWVDNAGESLLMSIIVVPQRHLTEQFVFSASIATAIANVLQNFLPQAIVKIKWPNDIIINDKKAAGILIENVIRGSEWTHSVVGIGMNVKQPSFSGLLTNATSLKLAGGMDVDMDKIRDRLREHIMASALYPAPVDRVMANFNGVLYKRGEMQAFSDRGGIWVAQIIDAEPDGTLKVRQANGETVRYVHGQVKWEWI